MPSPNRSARFRLPESDRYVVLAPVLRLQIDARLVPLAIESEVPADEEKVFIAKFNVKEMGFFEREYYNSTNVLLKVIDYTLGKNQEINGKNLRDNLFAMKTFKSGNRQHHLRWRQHRQAHRRNPDARRQRAREGQLHAEVRLVPQAFAGRP